MNVCTSFMASKASFDKSNGTSVGGFTCLGKNPTRDNPRVKRVLEPPAKDAKHV